MRNITLPYYVDTRPVQDKAPAPVTEVERFMDANLFECQLLAARITARQCELNRTNNTYLCGKCIQARPENKAAKLAKRTKRRNGDNPESPWRSQLYDRAALSAFEALSGEELPKAEQSRPESVKPRIAAKPVKRAL